jgi:hypothetical protein
VTVLNQIDTNPFAEIPLIILNFARMEKMIIDNDVLFTRVEDLLLQGKKVTIPVKGYSMLPFIRGERDLVELEHVELSGLRAMDIVLFHYGGRYVLHRVTAVSDGRVDIQGDGVVSGCEHCPPGRVIGRATAILRRGKRRVDPFGDSALGRVRLWHKLLPYRRYLLIIYRLLPWNWWILLQQLRERRSRVNK